MVAWELLRIRSYFNSPRIRLYPPSYRRRPTPEDCPNHPVAGKPGAHSDRKLVYRVLHATI